MSTAQLDDAAVLYSIFYPHPEKLKEQNALLKLKNCNEIFYLPRALTALIQSIPVSQRTEKKVFKLKSGVTVEFKNHH